MKLNYIQSLFLMVPGLCLLPGFGSSIHAANKPVRVILAIDNSGSMCQCDYGCNDSSDQRIRAAHLFVDSLTARSSNSEVGIERFGGSATAYRELSPSPLNTAGNISSIHNAIKDAACDPSDDNYVYKRLTTTETYQGNAIQRSLNLVDNNYDQIKDSLERHIIILTDDGWTVNGDMFPDSIINEYRRSFPGRPLPVINTVFLSSTTISNDENLQAIADSTGGSFMPNATPSTIVQYYLNVLDSISAIPTKALQPLTFDNSNTGVLERFVFHAWFNPLAQEVTMHVPHMGANTSLNIYDIQGKRIADLTNRMTALYNKTSGTIMWKPGTLVTQIMVVRLKIGDREWKKTVHVHLKN